MNSPTDGNLLYFTNPYNPHNDLNIYQKIEFEFTLSEGITNKKSNINIRSIYIHRFVSLNVFNNKFLNKLFQKTSIEKKNGSAFTERLKY